MEDNIIEIIDQLNDAGISLNDLEKIKPFIGLEDFNATFNIVTSMNAALQPIGQNVLRDELKKASIIYHENENVIRLRKITRYSFPLIAASIFIVCIITILHVITDYNNPNHYRKQKTELVK
jgi:hypothetical protein